MITIKSAVPMRGAALFLFFLASGLLGSAQEGNAVAACPVGYTFTATNKLQDAIQPVLNDLAIASMGIRINASSGKLNMGMGDPLRSQERDMSTRTSRSLHEHVWELSVPRGSRLSANRIIVNYSIDGSAGNQGSLRSVKNPSSRIDVFVFQRGIERTIMDDRIIFRGYVDLAIDFGNASAGGEYAGVITSTIDCM